MTVHYEDNFRIDSIYKKISEKQRMSAVAVAVGGSGEETRQDVEQGSILPTKADKLLSLHGPNNQITIYRHNWLSTQPPFNSASSPVQFQFMD